MNEWLRMSTCILALAIEDSACSVGCVNAPGVVDV